MNISYREAFLGKKLLQKYQPNNRYFSVYIDREINPELKSYVEPEQIGKNNHYYWRNYIKLNTDGYYTFYTSKTNDTYFSPLGNNEVMYETNSDLTIWFRGFSFTPERMEKILTQVELIDMTKYHEGRFNEL